MLPTGGVMKKAFLLIIGFFLVCYFCIESSFLSGPPILKKTGSMAQKEVSLFAKSDSIWTRESQEKKRFVKRKDSFTKAVNKATKQLKANKKTATNKKAAALKQKKAKKKKAEDKKKLAKKKKEEEKRKADELAKKLAEQKKKQEEQLDTLKAEVRTYVTGAPTKTDQEDDKNKKGLKEWEDLIFSNYNKEVNNDFFFAFQNSEISNSDFYIITQLMLDNSVKYQEDAFRFLMQKSSIQSFEQLVIHAEKDTTNSELRESIANHYSNHYANPDKLGILKVALQSNKEEVVVTAAKIIKISIETNIVSARGRNVGLENTEEYFQLFNYLKNLSQGLESDVALNEVNDIMDLLISKLNISVASID